jgi:hypothetical protein
MTKNAIRAKRFQNIDAAIKSIYNEVAWRDRRGRHEYEIHPVPVADRGLTSPSAGGPVMKTVQYDAGTEGIRGLSRLVDRLTELQQAEQRYGTD